MTKLAKAILQVRTLLAVGDWWNCAGDCCVCCRCRSEDFNHGCRRGSLYFVDSGCLWRAVTDISRICLTGIINAAGSHDYRITFVGVADDTELKVSGMGFEEQMALAVIECVVGGEQTSQTGRHCKGGPLGSVLAALTTEPYSCAIEIGQFVRQATIG